MVSEVHRFCRDCGVSLKESNWYPSCARRRNWICKVCHGKKRRSWYELNKEKMRLYNVEYRIMHKTDIKMQMRQHKYGVSRKEWDGLLRSQDNKCYLCGREFGESFNLRPEIDHNHSTGEIRGIAHGGCNRIIGMVDESPDLLEKISTSLRMSRKGAQNHGLA